MSRLFAKISPFLRRAFVFGLSLATLAAVGGQMQTLLAPNGLTAVEVVWLVLFLLSFGWIAFSFWSLTGGFLWQAFGMRTRRLVWPSDEQSRAPLTSKTAVLVPIHNEDPVAVCANVEAMYESLAKTGQLDSFHFFLLSDTTDPDIWVAEEMEWAALCERLSATGQIFYRRRPQNTGKKAGNVAEFCRRWGKRYDWMILLDADSLLTGEAMVKMARLMENNPHAGIIQAPPQAVMGRTLFARLQQFASRLFGPMNAAGLAFWQMGDSNYWGHNAIVRTSAFMAHCGLPDLPGGPPLGGQILSHDFVEAALIRRAGYTVWLVPELEGSYEQVPPNLIDYVGRDRRWCQGNLQHLRLVFARGMHPSSRIHFLSGVMAYVSSLICVLLLVTGVWLALAAQLEEPVYFPPHETLFPNWRVFDGELAIRLGVVSFALLLLPKFLALFVTLARSSTRKQFGGALKTCVGFVIEIVGSVLIAPTLMLFHASFVVSALTGHRIEWTAQNRADRNIGWEEAGERQGAHALLGAILFAGLYFASPGLLPWMAPVIAGLFLSMSLTVFTSSARVGLWLGKLGLLSIPEELSPPEVIVRAQALEAARRADAATGDGLERVLSEPLTHAIHQLLLLDERTPPKDAALAERAFALVTQGRAFELSREEKRALLHDGRALETLHRLRLEEQALLAA